LPDWLAWETFGAERLPDARVHEQRIGGIRARIDYRAQSPSNEIGCILLAQPTFFQPDDWGDRSARLAACGTCDTSDTT
jgi:hypothetical protein